MLLGMWMPGTWELVIIGVVAVLLFGNRLPKIARSLGSSFIEFKRGVQTGMDEVTEAKEMFEDEVKDVKNTLEK